MYKVTHQADIISLPFYTYQLNPSRHRNISSINHRELGALFDVNTSCNNLDSIFKNLHVNPIKIGSGEKTSLTDENKELM